MTKQELIYNIRVKMDMDPTADSEDYYLNYYNTLINECLSVIANTVLPYQQKMEVFWLGFWEESTPPKNKEPENVYYTLDTELTIDGKVGKRRDWLECKNGEWRIQKRNTYGFLASIPNGFLSFSDEAPIEFRNNYDELSFNVDVLYVNSTTLALSKDGNYTIYYNSEYPNITDDTENLDFIPTNVLKIIPSYVAGQLLMGEDPIKATQLKNEFETMLARLDTNKPLVSYNINNSDGWVL